MLLNTPESLCTAQSSNAPYTMILLSLLAWMRYRTYLLYFYHFTFLFPNYHAVYISNMIGFLSN
uniref:Uncharacterized protein n=1 Tax=Picea glauca TaxID=3330 RepID=A0A101LUS0_PICGL|nr:hypothetical protein ABT39_MTgene2295 [Picea glauca]QHR87957.1 hypothetical protein Q903MT_gene1969 [Picea sitchensis]